MENKEDIKKKFKELFGRNTIICKCVEDEETPLGIILTLLRDYFYLPKTIGWDIAYDLIKDYRLEKPTNENKSHAILINNYNTKR